MGKSKLSDEQKDYVVRRLAGHDSPSAIVKALAEDFGVSVTRNAVIRYDPTSYIGARECAKRWRKLFLEARAAFNAGKTDIGAANKMVRVRWLDGMARAAMDKEHFMLAAALLKQVAEEMGDRFTNRQKLEHTGKDGGAIDIAAVSDHDRARAIAALINKAKAAGAPASEPAQTGAAGPGGVEFGAGDQNA